MNVPPLEQQQQQQHQVPVVRSRQYHYRRVMIQLIFIGGLGGLAIVLQLCVMHLESEITRRQVQMQAAALQAHSSSSLSRSNINEQAHRTTVQYSLPTDGTESHAASRMHGGTYGTGASRRTSAEAFWQQAIALLDLQEWDVGIANVDHVWSIGDRSNYNNATTGMQALQQAVAMGHPQAQRVYANVLASGILPNTLEQQQQLVLQEQRDDVVIPKIQEDWENPTDSAMHQAYVLWHMAAIGGDIEATMILADRFKNRPCEERLPYVQAIADRIIDELEADPQSRAKVLPATDRHVLYQVHLHGGTASRLDMNNRPDESADAIQFYHVRAMDKTDPSQQAAFTLGQLYKLGLRGVTQNLTAAVEYYERAAKNEHWEAAGQAGMMYLWGIGVKQDPVKAHRLFRIGIPDGLEDCLDRYRRKKMNPLKESIYTCESTCLNGMGLIRLLGLPLVAPVNLDLAQSYFKLAKDQGDEDAAYNLAMVRLGWKSYFQSTEKLDENGVTDVFDEFSPLSGKSPKTHPTQGEYTAIMTDLATAASKGHVQAKHRLGKMYAEGVTIPSAKTGGTTVVQAKDCPRAIKHFQSIVDIASPIRAKRLRQAYRDYVAGETAKSLRNYLAAAETGSDLAQLNAAFLLERGECLGLRPVECSKAAVRLWKVAASKLFAEASLRVGDFYYYGRFRDDPYGAVVGPFGWIQYLLYPEKYIPLFFQRMLHKLGLKVEDDLDSQEKSQVCVSDEQEGTCLAVKEDTLEVEHSLEKDLSKAAHYYVLAAEKSSPRAYYNLGFMYEWGLGLKQDFPLAKRNYDLAMSGSGEGEAVIPVSLSLLALSLHELAVKKWRTFQDWLDQPETKATKMETGDDGQKVTKYDVIIGHIFSLESLVIALLTILLCALVRKWVQR